MSAVIKYIDKAGLDEIFRIIAEKDKDTLDLLNALSEKIQDIKKVADKYFNDKFVLTVLAQNKYLSQVDDKDYKRNLKGTKQ